MRLSNLTEFCLLVLCVVWNKAFADSYHPPLLQNTPHHSPVLSSNPYHPPIGLSRSSDFQNAQELHIPLQYQMQQVAPSAISYSVAKSPHDNSGFDALGSNDRNAKSVAESASTQLIHRTPAVGTDADKAGKDGKNDEYVVYYYYYYDNDTTASSNNSNFDDIPSLESYDVDRKQLDASKNRGLPTTNINSLDTSGNSQPRSVSGASGRSLQDPANIQPLKPVSNVYRYGSNEVPRFPILPNFAVQEIPITSAPREILSGAELLNSVEASSIPAPSAEDDESNNVLDVNTDLKKSEEPSTTTTTTEATTTTTEATTTTEKSRRPSIGAGGRRRFNPSRTRPAVAAATNTSRSVSSTPSTTGTTSSSPTRRSFGGGANRGRLPRPSTAPSSRSRAQDNLISSSTTTSTTAASRSRFTSAAPRRFQSSRSRSSSSSQAPRSSTTTSTTRTPSRLSSRPRPNLISRNRPPRPGFPRRPEPEETPETTTTTPEEDSTETKSDEETDNEDQEEDNTTEEPTTTEVNRFSALFRPRNRSALGNRPRPVIGGRS